MVGRRIRTGFDCKADLSKKADAKHNPANSSRFQQTQLMRQKGFSVDFKERFRDMLGSRAEPRRQPTRQNGDREHVLLHDVATTRVPWKSKPKRTSCSPASRNTRRNRVLSSV